MTNKTDLIAQLKSEYPTIKRQDDDEVTELTLAEYEATIKEWADNLLATEAKVLAIQTAKSAAETKLAALGLTPDDLKAIGL